MSFSFSAGGTKTQTLESLAKVTHHQNTPQALVDLLIDMVGSGPGEHRVHDGTVLDVVYSLSAHGHSSAGAGHDTPTLRVTLDCSYRPKPEHRGGIESESAPADVR